MSWWSDLLKAIPLSSVLKERLALAEQKFEHLEGENKKLKEEVATLTTENSLLKCQLAKAEAKQDRENEQPEIIDSCYYFRGDRSKLYCVACYDTENKRHLMAVIPHVGRICTICNKFIAGGISPVTGGPSA